MNTLLSPSSNWHNYLTMDLAHMVTGSSPLRSLGNWPLLQAQPINNVTQPSPSPPTLHYWPNDPKAGITAQIWTAIPVHTLAIKGMLTAVNPFASIAASLQRQKQRLHINLEHDALYGHTEWTGKVIVLLHWVRCHLLNPLSWMYLPVMAPLWLLCWGQHSLMHALTCW